MTDAVVVLCTAPNEAVAQELAKGLLEARLVACVTLFAGARSFYRWKGRVEEASEQQLLIKTQRAQSDAALAWLRTHHPYDVPELLVLPVTGGDADYLGWIADEVG